MTTAPTVSFHREALLRMLAMLFAAARIEPDGSSDLRLSLATQSLVLRVLRPMESAVRRLIVILSWTVALPTRRQRVAKPEGAVKRKTVKIHRASARAPVFALFDRRKFFHELADSRKRFIKGPGPRIWLLDGTDPPRPPVPEKPVPDPEDARRIGRRLQAVRRALDDMPAQARRLLVAMEKRAKAPPGPGRYGPLRPGWPPGFRKHRTHEIDDLLCQCHAVAWHGPPRAGPS